MVLQMITLAICLIYYGLALFLYQANGWLVEGRWTPFPVRRAWEAYLGAPSVETPFLRLASDWLLSWPLSMTLALVGSLLLVLVFTTRHLRGVRRDQLRRRWLAEQVSAAGYQSWAMPKVLGAVEDQIRAEDKARRAAGHRT